VIDGDSFAHRSYYALPKTIRRSDGKGAGAILGFANFLLRHYADERPRAVIVGWDSLGAPTKRHEMFPAYQSGREFDDDLIEQLNVLPELVAAFGLRTPNPRVRSRRLSRRSGCYRGTRWRFCPSSSAQRF
jgi:DNA polymerase I